MEALKGYKTVIIKTVLLIVGLLVMGQVIPADKVAGLTEQAAGDTFDLWVGGATSVMAVLALVLRLFTTTPIGVKD